MFNARRFLYVLRYLVFVICYRCVAPTFLATPSAAYVPCCVTCPLVGIICSPLSAILCRVSVFCELVNMFCSVLAVNCSLLSVQ